MWLADSTSLCLLAVCWWRSSRWWLMGLFCQLNGWQVWQVMLQITAALLMTLHLRIATPHCLVQ